MDVGDSSFDISDVIAFTLSISAIAAGAGLYLYEPTQPMERVHDVSLEENSVTLHTSCYDLTMYTNPMQTQAIQDGYDNEEPFRPGTHDLMVDLLSETGSNIDRVEINGFQNNAYLADIVLDTGVSTRVDSRPTDAVAVASRTDTPVYISRPVLTSYGEFTCDGTV